MGLGWVIGSPTVTMIIGGIGGAMLIYIGYSIARSPVPDELPGDGEPIEKKGVNYKWDSHQCYQSLLLYLVGYGRLGFHA